MIVRGTPQEDAVARFDELEHISREGLFVDDGEASVGIDSDNVGKDPAWRGAKLSVDAVSSGNVRL